jgi:hypothetical protein
MLQLVVYHLAVPGIDYFQINAAGWRLPPGSADLHTGKLDFA